MDAAGTFTDTSMSQEATAQRSRRQHWAAPNGRHDKFVRWLKRGLPVLTLIVAAYLTAAPFAHRGEVSFVLDKNRVAMAGERLKVVEAVYRGTDSEGRPFALRAGSALQKTSRDPIVQLNDLNASLQLKSGPATVAAAKGQYDMGKEQVSIDGPIHFETADGYHLATSDVDILLDKRSLASRGAVQGDLPTGTFSADHLSADLDARTVTLTGRARLHINQFGRKGRR